MITQAIFIIVSLFTLVTALLVVRHPNLFSSALYLVASFFGVASLYVLLEADFLAVVQVMVYIGAISILIIFAIMLSKGMMGKHTSPHNQQDRWVALAGLLLAIILLYFLVALVQWPTTPVGPVPANAIQLLGQDLVGRFVMPFEIASVLLLAALIGAIAIAREREI